MKITIHSEYDPDYTVDLDRKDKDVYAAGGLICCVSPWGASGIPLQLGICICPDGRILHRGWSWTDNPNPWLHTSQTLKGYDAPTVTQEMCDTVAGLFSGRIKVDGLKIGVGGTVQDVCPIDLEREEKLAGKKIYVANTFPQGK